MKRLAFVALSVLLTATLVLTGCTTTTPPPTTTTGVQPMSIRVATDATWPPFESVNDQTKQIEGFDIDLMKAIAAKENITVQFINVGFDPLLAGMAQGQYDAAISSITITAERAQQMLFSDPYFNAGQIITVRTENTSITSQSNLSGKKAGAQLGTTGAIEVGKISGATLKTYDDIGLAFQDLLNGQIDAVVCDNPVALEYVSKNSTKLKTVGTIFTNENYGIAVAKGKTELLARLNDGLAKVKAEGLITSLTTKWWPK